VSPWWVPLLDLLQRATPRFEPERKNDWLRHAVLARGTDGYEAVVAWGEFDPDFGARRVLVAFEDDGQRLERPRLVVQGDRHGGRNVSDIDRISLVLVSGS
jgi:hypothetical protein